MFRKAGMEPVRKALIVFMRYPEVGKVKTRLGASIGMEEAAWAYEKLVRRALGVVVDLKHIHSEVEAFVFFTPNDGKGEIGRAFPGPWQFIPQEGRHLGERMQRAFDHVMACGYNRAVMIGTDIADVDVATLEEAFDELEPGCAVLGPAADGGFYLIGLDRPCASAFEHEQWGTDGIYGRTERLLSEAGFHVRRVRQRQDIDRPEDLSFLKDKAFFRDSLSVIVPTLSPIDHLRPFLALLETSLWPGDEIIVVRGKNGSAADCRDCDSGRGEDCRRIRLRCIDSPPGRGLQMNRGADIARGGLFLFLHDDCVPPPHFAYAVRKILEAPRKSLGCFHLAFSPSSPALDGIARWANFRTLTFALPYGDQGLFCRREIFEKMGGFRRRYLMEDVDFVQRCRQWGDLMILPEAIRTSSRRYLEKGILRASLQNHLLMLCYYLGISDKKLHSLYYRL